MAAPIAITPGEPAGIGPDLLISIAQLSWRAPLVAFADPGLLQQRASQLQLPLQLIEVSDANPPQTACAPGQLYVRGSKLREPVIPGTLNHNNAAYVLETISGAARGCLRKQYSALVTGPVHKGVINDAGRAFTGHTEFLAEISGGYPVMMLACPGLRVALATTHLPLREIADSITGELLKKVIGILDLDLRRHFGIEQPNILVCGLNPHAGEGGHLGHEEIEIIEPTLRQLRKQGIRLQGPLPADTLFTPHYMAQADAVLAMYHDQGLPVLKHKGFGQAVNITLGLPLVRTSVDHGTALDLAGRGKCSSGSMVAAIEQALCMTTANPVAASS